MVVASKTTNTSASVPVRKLTSKIEVAAGFEPAMVFSLAVLDATIALLRELVNLILDYDVMH
jgi:hypothetical protein